MKESHEKLVVNLALAAFTFAALFIPANLAFRSCSKSGFDQVTTHRNGSRMNLVDITKYGKTRRGWIYDGTMKSPSVVMTVWDEQFLSCEIIATEGAVFTGVKK